MHKDNDIARLLMILDQYQDVRKTIGDIATVVPIKGIALLQTLYAENLDRSVSDIDLVILPLEKLPEVTERLIATGLYRHEFEYLKDPQTILVKKKVSLLSNSPFLTDIDVHGAFFTKKYFPLSCPNFNDDVISRLRKSPDDNSATMDPVDQWLFLAEHACFHMFTNNKWVRDLYLLQQNFTGQEHEQLQQRIEQYGFGRIAWGAYTRMRALSPDANVAMAEPLVGEAPIFKRFICHYHSRPRTKRGVRMMLTIRFYEFIHIQRWTKRFSAYLSLIFPSLQMVRTIYRKPSKLKSLIIYPGHVMLSAVSLAAFQTYYFFAAIFRRG